MANSRKFVAKTKDVSLTVRRADFLVLVMLIVKKIYFVLKKIKTV